MIITAWGKSGYLQTASDYETKTDKLQQRNMQREMKVDSHLKRQRWTTPIQKVTTRKQLSLN